MDDFVLFHILLKGHFTCKPMEIGIIEAAIALSIMNRGGPDTIA